MGLYGKTKRKGGNNMENTNETKKQEIEKVKTTNETNYIWRKLVETKRYDIRVNNFHGG